MKMRLDQLLVERGLAESRRRAQGLILAGLVLVDDRRVDKPGRQIDADAPIRVTGDPCPYVSRGGLKLEAALRHFSLTDLAGRLALDVGASTGGFTDCLLRHGAAHVWAVDTGRGQFHMDLRRDSRVTLREQSNARYLTPDWVDARPMDLIAIDVSFISLRLILPPLRAVIAPQGSVVALVKPQFEAGREHVGEGGVVRDPAVHRRVLDEFTAFARADGWPVLALCNSPILGPAGNREFFVRLGAPSTSTALGSEDVHIAIERLVAAPYNES